MNDPLCVLDVHGNKLPVWFIDFESYYDTKAKYSLGNKKTTTVSYIRDSRFRAHGCSYVDPDGNSGWVTHKKLKGFFDSIDWSKTAFAAQNCIFDGFIAYEHYNVEAAYYIDIMCMSLGEWGSGLRHSLDAICDRLGLEGKIKGSLEKTDGVPVLSLEQEEALIPYAIQDSEQARFAFEKLYFDRGYPEQEMHVIDITLRMFCVPVLRINPAVCLAEIEAEDIRMEALLNSDIIKDAVLSDATRSVFMSKGIEGMMRSRDCFAELLRSRGIEPPLKERKKAGVIIEGEYTYAFAKDDEELLNLADDPRVSDLVALWTGSKSTLRKTRAQRFLDVSEHGKKPFPIPLKYCGARTNRWSGCLTADNYVIVSRENIVKEVSIKDVQLTDLVWDGEEFVSHDGVVFSGKQKVITYAGITGTGNHPVLERGRERYTALETAKARGCKLALGRTPCSSWLKKARYWIIQTFRSRGSILLQMW